jgi:inosine-uridine nucleoside N-ribohydrolase
MQVHRINYGKFFTQQLDKLMRNISTHKGFIMQSRFEKTLRSRKNDNKLTLVFNSDDGVDDALAQLLALAQTAVSNDIKIAGIVASVGNAILGQTEINVRRILELVQQKDIPVFPGALTPLGLERNVSEIDAAINATHFYGYDGLADQPPESWLPITIPLQKKKGYEFIAELVFNASAINPITLVSTASLTEVYKALFLLDEMCKYAKLPFGCFSKNLVIVAMGGVIDPASGANAPFDWPDYNKKTCIPKNPPCKDAEANFYWDTLATQGVFNLCAKYGIKIQLITLDLTQKTGLLWTKNEVKGLRSINNRVALQIANITNVVPWIDAKHFLNETFPWHDGLTLAWILWKQLFQKIEMAIKIGKHGETFNNTNPLALKNVDLISILPNKMAECMNLVISLFNNFNSIHKKPLGIDAGPTLAKLETSAASNTLLPPIYFLPRKLIRILSDYFHNKQKVKEEGFVQLSTRESPCFYPDKTTNILKLFNQQPNDALIRPCQLPKTEEKSIKIDQIGSFKNGLVQGALEQLFFKQNLSKEKRDLALQGTIAASIAHFNFPLACLYIASANLPKNSLENKVMTALMGLAIVTSTNPWELLMSSLSHLFGYLLAMTLIDSVMDSPKHDRQFTFNL